MESLFLAQNLSLTKCQEIRSEKGVNILTISELLPSLSIGAALVFVQIFAQKIVFKNLAVALGVVGEAKWRNPRDEKLLMKFSEALWKLLCYSCLCTYGAITLFRKSWIWNTREYWTDYPFQNVDPDVKYYYLFEIGLYLSLSVTQSLGPKRKDSWLMAAHHVVTLGLLLLSWRINAVRVGSVILLCHDVADIPLELGKIGSYVKAERLKSCSFNVFTATWFLTRLGIFPFYLVRTTWDAYRRTGDPFLGAGVGLLGVLLALHISWTYLLLKVIAQVYVQKKELEDIRSSDEDEDPHSDQHRKRK